MQHIKVIDNWRCYTFDSVNIYNSKRDGTKSGMNLEVRFDNEIMSNRTVCYGTYLILNIIQLKINTTKIILIQYENDNYG